MDSEVRPEPLDEGSPIPPEQGSDSEDSLADQMTSDELAQTFGRLIGVPEEQPELEPVSPAPRKEPEEIDPLQLVG
jgi:hypothetical protein